MQRIFFALIAIAALACAKQSTDPNAPTVAFAYDAPFCGRTIIEKSIDHTVVEVDSMSSGTTSRPFAVTAGDHVLSARQLRLTSGPPVTNYQWPDTTVTLNEGATLVRMLSLYCS